MNSRRSINRRTFLRSIGLGTAGMVVTACTTPTATPMATSQAPAAVGTNALPAALPIVEDKLTLTYWVPLSGNVGATLTTYADMTCYKEMEKLTNIHLEFQHPPTGQEAEQFNLMVASGKFPDVIENGGWLGAPGGPAKYLRDGVILRLNELIEEHAPNLSKVLADHPEWRRMILTDEGDIYAFPFLRSDPYLLTFQGPIMRGDWLEKVGAEVPTTIDEWHQVLTLFKEQNPGGAENTYPFTPMLYNAPLQSFKGSHAFIGAWNIAYNFYQEGGVVKFGMVQPEFKEFLTVMAQWYEEGLIDPDFPTTDGKLLDAKVTGNQLGAFVQNTGGGIGKYMGLMATKDPTFQLVPAPYPTLRAGETPAFGQRDFNYTGTGAAISTANQHVEETVRLLDWAYSEEGYNLFNFGLEGLTYNWVNGYPQYTDLILKNPDGLPVNQAMGQHFRSSFNGPFVQAKEYFEQYSAMPAQKQSLEVWTTPTNEKQMPLVTPTQEESREFANIMNDINTRADEAVIRIITGQDPVDNWDTVVSELNSIGIEQAIQIQQGALERYNNRP
jgi:putative aldouronate transport system substrate-binding protein